MYPVVIENISATQGIDLKNELLKAGLVLNVDFEWAFSHAIRDSYAYTIETPSRVMFLFTDPANATFYTLKWL